MNNEYLDIVGCEPDINADVDEIYREHGYRNRGHYLKTLCEEYDSEKVYALAQLLGPEEDFDGLVVELEDDSIC